MVQTYVIDKDIFQISSETELDSFLAKSNRFFDTIRKQTLCVDCNAQGMYNLLVREYQDLRQIIDDQIVKKNLESFFIRHIEEKYIFAPKSCSCDNRNKCNIGKNINSIITKTNVIPKFIVTYNKNISINEINSIDLNDIDSDSFFCSCRDNTASEFQTSRDYNDGKDIIKLYWEDILRICNDEIIILDRNIFRLWNNNYEKGLLQFVEVIQDINSNIKLRLITKGKMWYDYKPGNSPQDNYKKIGDTLTKVASIKVQVDLCESMDHERYILFDEHLGAELNRGLDTFVPIINPDVIKITYHHASEVINKRKKALKTLIKYGDFKPIKNY